MKNSLFENLPPAPRKEERAGFREVFAPKAEKPLPRPQTLHRRPAPQIPRGGKHK
jgi:hypothetical protein